MSRISMSSVNGNKNKRRRRFLFLDAKSDVQILFEQTLRQTSDSLEKLQNEIILTIEILFHSRCFSLTKGLYQLVSNNTEAGLLKGQT